ncbi:phage antirepressor KilAC domain-containing protein [Pasteurella multocida subsp. multocida]|uniref:Phage antirepressor KilAC domain-containing protein n=1 Tax=Pasteurella multocida TaxID=747 RepID=A0A9X3UND3_PASMD|nr:phage antirepressor KilAC domain-containing protein [Pasteurella multocida]MDA5609492.1 phage antirepressor KilAC domain-containing protein [Pasteurella multocida]MDA5612223.1 phage antirepressor KilAC domain-containing protein [Pasteurella multocida]MDA5618452.1 phage antirepressor KilAC domain-containing protein [Pasteurella multocida subsp. multocida]MDA5620814.1 phage antirepressor KilAC domain-containing protein [Pasteurella multocida subsp. multocida]MDA5622004.1 phage antirepressor K
MKNKPILDACCGSRMFHFNKNKRPGNSNWIAYQDKLQQLLLEHKIHVAMRDDGTEKVCERVLITAKGLTKLAKIFELQQAA